MGALGLVLVAIMVLALAIIFGWTFFEVLVGVALAVLLIAGIIFIAIIVVVAVVLIRALT